MDRSHHRLYKTKRWQRLRKHQLDKHPYCQCPHHKGRFQPGTVVDHIVPHKGDTKLFYDQANLQTLTKQCHDKFKQSQESGGPGFDQGVNESGEPLNQDSSWYTR